jgi:hypothetical protein
VPRRWAGTSTDPAPELDSGPKRGDRAPNAAWNKLLLLVGVAVVLAAVLVVPGILNRGGQNPIADAAQATREAPGVRMSFEMSAQGPVPMTMTGTGVMNGETQRAWLEFSANVLSSGQDFSMTEVVEHLDLYMRAPQITQELAGKSWLLIRAESFLGDLYQGGSGGIGAGMSANPAQQLETLESASDDVTVVGHEAVRAVDTTHYTAVIDMQRILDELRSDSSKLADLVEKTLDGVDGNETVDVWIDGDGLVRRLHSNIPMGPLGTFTMGIDFTDYGIHPKIDVPPESDVYDATPLLDQILDS